VNNKIYIGVHKTHDMNDGYMGSGKVIKRAMEKYGSDNFRKDILEEFQDSKSMYDREKEIVTEEVLSRDDVYNLRRGGHGGFDYINQHSLNQSGDRTHARKVRAQNLYKGTQRRILAGKCGFQLKPSPGFKTTEQRENALVAMSSPESREKKKATWKKNNRGKGNKNSQFGTIWITNENKNVKIKKTDPIPEGWRRGRVVLS
jgi:hypothetical protein